MYLFILIADKHHWPTLKCVGYFKMCSDNGLLKNVITFYRVAGSLGLAPGNGLAHYPSPARRLPFAVFAGGVS